MHSFDEAGEALQALAEAMATVVLAPDAPLWRSGSRAAREAQEEPSYAGAWGDRPLRAAVAAAHMSLDLAHSHLLGMAALFPLADVLTAPVTLSRTVSTACASSYWLLDPTVNARERVRRTMNARLASIAEAAELQGAADANESKLIKLSRDVIETAEGFGFAAKTERARAGRIWRLQYLDEKVPSDMALGRALLGGNRRVSDAQYRIGSAAIHAQSHGLQLLDLGSRDAADPQGLRVDLAAMLVYTSGAVLGIYRAGLRYLEHSGVPTYRWERLGSPVLKMWRDGMR